MLLYLTSENSKRIKICDSTEELSDNTVDVVYSDEKYCFTLELDPDDDFENNFKDIRIYNGTTEIDIAKTKKISENVYNIIPKKENFFDMTYGLTNIAFETDKYFCYSNRIAVAFRDNDSYKQNKASLEIMIEDIFSREHSFFRTGKYSDCNLKNIRPHENIKFENEIKILEEIVEIYNNCCSNFAINPYNKATSSYSVEKTEKLTSVDSKILQYIAENPHNLRFCDVPTGLTHNKLPITPTKTLVKNVARNVDIYENRQVLGFLLYLLNYVDDKTEEIKNEITKKTDPVADGDLKEGYDLPANIITLCTAKLYEDYFSAYSDIKQKLLTLKAKYSSFLPVKAVPINSIPMLTPIFLEIFHYNNIFSVIKKWFSHGKFKVLDSDTILNFPCADEIYELYSIINIHRFLCDSGYKELHRECYKYFKDDKKTKLETKTDNTFLFQKGDEKLVLYYQPIIWNRPENENTNNLTLCKINNKSSHFRPDFVIKRIKDNKTEYTILDSKWRSITAVKNSENGLQESIFKYYCSIINTENFEPVTYLWLLSGKKDCDNVYYFRNNDICRKNPGYFDKIGIAALYPGNNNAEFKKLMSKITG